MWHRADFSEAGKQLVDDTLVMLLEREQLELMKDEVCEQSIAI